MRKFLSFAALLLTIAVIAMALTSVWAFRSYHQPGPLGETTLVVIERGKGVQSIAGDLVEAGAIENPLLFQIAARLERETLKAGEYKLSAQASMASILSMMIKGAVYQRQITIPEGLTSWQIINILNQAEDLTGPPLMAIPPEGALLPETYSYSRGATRQDMLDRMAAAMETVLEDLWPNRREGLPLETKEEALALAAIVEKETGVSDERARVAGVFINRLERGMPLQSDPTVIYALTGGKIQTGGQGPLGRRLLRKDLGFSSPYNTYENAGLPPGPIANPGRAAISATLQPEDHDFIFFVADGTGGHAFAKTLSEHNRNVAKWRQFRKEKGF